MNSGKVFEKCFKDSLKDIFCLRLKDGTSAWGTQLNTRFQSFNPCDMIVHHMGYLFLLELKSHKGKSIPFNCIREKQLSELCKHSVYEGVLPMIVFNFREHEKTYAVHIKDVEEFIITSKINDTRKSFPLAWVDEIGYYIPCKLKKVNYSYDVVSTLNEIIATIPQ
jgi:recombination protein U